MTFIQRGLLKNDQIVKIVDRLGQHTVTYLEFFYAKIIGTGQRLKLEIVSNTKKVMS